MQIRIETSDFEQAWSRLESCHASRTSPTGPSHLRLFGPSGVGKTFLMKQYVLAHPPVWNEEGCRVKVAYVPIPSAPTPKGIYLAMLRALGIQGAYGTLEALRYRTLILLERCKTELLLFDELNHITDRGQLRTREAASDTVKELVDSSGLPAVFSGAPRSVVLFDANMQLRSRVGACLTLRPYDLNNRFSEMQGFILAFAKQFYEEDVARWLASLETASRIFFATDGVQRNISSFLTGIDGIRVDDDDRALCMLSQQFRLKIWEHPSDSLDPFSRGFEMRRLNEPGEPFSPSSLDGDNHDAFQPDTLRQGRARRALGAGAPT